MLYSCNASGLRRQQREVWRIRTILLWTRENRLTKKRKSSAADTGPSQRPPKQPTYPTPAERQRIVERRNKLLRELVPLTVQELNATQLYRLVRLIDKYGSQEIERVMAAFEHGVLDRVLIGEDSQIYRRYRQAFARFGGDQRFLSKREFKDRVEEHARLMSRRSLLSLIRRQPGRRVRELEDLLLMGVCFWEDITPPAVPPQPTDFEAPVAGDYALPARDLLSWGWDLDEERLARAGRKAARWRPAVPDLARMAVDEGLLDGWPGRMASWAPYHALHLLGYLRAHDHAARLLALLDWDDDWLSDRLPVVWGRMGSKAEPPLWTYLDDKEHPPDKRALVLLGLGAIAKAAAERRSEIVAALVERLGRAPAADATLNAHLVLLLDDLQTFDARDAITDAFAEGRIDTGIVGLYELSILREAEAIPDL